MVLTYVIVGLLMGVIFGFALEKGRVFEPGIIVGQFQLRNFIMMKMFLSAIAVTMVVFAILVAFGWAQFHPKALALPAVIGGGLIFGAGMALAGGCPGTVLAQIGAGYIDAWAILFGGIFGAMAFGYLEPTFKSWTLYQKKMTVATLTGWPFWVLAVIGVVVLALIIYLLEARKSWTAELGRDNEGLLVEVEPTND